MAVHDLPKVEARVRFPLPAHVDPLDYSLVPDIIW